MTERGPPPGFRGLLCTPQSEMEAIILASLMFRELGICILRAGDRFPDWSVFIPDGNGGKREVNCEVELRSSSFRSHLKQWRNCRDSCQLILCWEHDRDPTNDEIPILDIRSHFFRLPKERQSQLCWEAANESVREADLRPPFDFDLVPKLQAPIAKHDCPPDFHGLIYEPTTEIETIILMAMLLPRTDLCIANANDAFPDWTVLQDLGNTWRRQRVELECDALAFRSHRQAMQANRNGCQGIIAWDKSVSNLPDYFPDTMLVKSLLMSQPDPLGYCQRRREKSSPITLREINGFLVEHLPAAAAETFNDIADGLHELGYLPNTGPRRDGFSYQFASERHIGPVKTETLNLFCFNRGRYIRPTLWWSVSSLRKTSVSPPILDHFEQQIGKITHKVGIHDITYGVHCESTEFHRIVEPVLQLASAIRSELW